VTLHAALPGTAGLRPVTTPRPGAGRSVPPAVAGHPGSEGATAPSGAAGTGYGSKGTTTCHN
jgi:hypothetical protein